MKYPLVLLHWDDAASDHGWKDASEVEVKNEQAITVGFVIKETDDHILIAATIDADGNTNDRSQIPKKMIVKRVALKYKM